MSVEPELKVELELEAHEKECALRYQMVEQRLSELNKRLWRLEAMIMGSTLVIIALASSVFMKL
jgi:fructose-bisphosphate aldolase class 1|tara:strand:+ start:715 stop:906 length:192 start_codon:yes stop_codon:yes gene_type:complete